MNVKIEIDTRTFVRFWLVVIGFALAALAIYSARSAIIILGAALFFAIALNPPVSMLANILPSKSRVLSTAMAYVAVVVFLGIVAFLVVPPISEQSVKFAQTVPGLIDSATQQYAGINGFVEKYNLQPEFDKLIKSLKDGASQFATGAGSILITSISSVLSAIANGVLIFVLAFLMLVEGPSWLEKLWSIYPSKSKMRHHKNMLKRMYGVVTGYVVGQLSISSVAGLVSGITVFLVSLMFSVPTNLAVPAAAIMLVLSLIPMFGEFVGIVIVSLLLLLNSPTAALVFFAVLVVYQQIENNYIAPQIQSKRIDLSALAILSAVTIGIYCLGVIGVIISIPIAGCIRVFAEEYHRYKKIEEQEAVASKKKLA